MLLRSNFYPFPQYFQYIFLIKGVYLHIHLLNLVERFVFSSILNICYVELRISRSVSEGPFKFEITRVDCITKHLSTEIKSVYPLVPNRRKHCLKTFIFPPVTYFGTSNEKTTLKTLIESKVTEIRMHHIL